MATVLKPQPGPQERFLATPAEIAIYGGAAGGGKSWCLLYAPLRYIKVQGYGATIFRKNYNQIFAQGGLWDEATQMYGSIPNTYSSASRGIWIFKDKDGVPVSRISFAHIERDEDLSSWQGSQLATIGFDELTHFSRNTFFYMLSRNRSTCGVKPFVRATCNPDANSWVADFISWWIDQDTGYPIPERSGKLRWFVRRDDVIYWADNKEELWKQFELITEEERAEPKSVTFISSSIYDNKVLLKTNPSYLANLKALPTVDRERLLMGNWKIKPNAGMYFKREQATIIDTLPKDIQYVCRAWDIAATEDKESGNPDYTAGVLMGLRRDKSIVIMDGINRRIKAGDVENVIAQTAKTDRETHGFRYKIRIPQDPGAAGKILANSYVKMLSGYNVKALPITGNKILRATPFAAFWQHGNVQVLSAPWTEAYLSQLESFPSVKHDDMVDASSDAFNELTSSSFDLKNLL